jgi:hypothetical protein
MITLPSTAVTDVTANIGTLVTDLWVLIALAMGLPFGFYIIKKLVSLLPKR